LGETKQWPERTRKQVFPYTPTNCHEDEVLAAIEGEEPFDTIAVDWHSIWNAQGNPNEAITS
jgi:hypothetical protein